MISTPLRTAIFAIAATATEVTAITSAAASDEHAAFAAMIAACIGTVVAAVAWIDARIDRRIADHAREDEARHETILVELRALRRD